MWRFIVSCPLNSMAYQCFVVIHIFLASGLAASSTCLQRLLVAVLSEEESSAFGKLEVQSSQQWELRFCCLSSSVFLPEVCVEDLRCCLGLASLLPAANCSEKEASDVGVLTALNFLCRLIVVLLWVSVPSVFFSTTGEKKSTGRACFWNAWSLSKMSS